MIQKAEERCNILRNENTLVCYYNLAIHLVQGQKQRVEERRARRIRDECSDQGTSNIRGTTRLLLYHHPHQLANMGGIAPFLISIVIQQCP